MAKIKRRTEDGWEEIYNPETIEALTRRISDLEDAWHSVSPRAKIGSGVSDNFGRIQLYVKESEGLVVSIMSGFRFVPFVLNGDWWATVLNADGSIAKEVDIGSYTTYYMSF